MARLEAPDRAIVADEPDRVAPHHGRHSGVEMEADLEIDELVVVGWRLRDRPHEGVFSGEPATVARHEQPPPVQKAASCLVAAMLGIQPDLVRFLEPLGRDAFRPHRREQACLFIRHEA